MDGHGPGPGPEHGQTIFPQLGFALRGSYFFLQRDRWHVTPGFPGEPVPRGIPWRHPWRLPVDFPLYLPLGTLWDRGAKLA